MTPAAFYDVAYQCPLRRRTPPESFALRASQILHEIAEKTLAAAPGFPKSAINFMAALLYCVRSPGWAFGPVASPRLNFQTE